MEGGPEKNTRKSWKDGQVKKLKFTYKEQKEWETIEDDIAALEEKAEALGRRSIRLPETTKNWLR